MSQNNGTEPLSNEVTHTGSPSPAREAPKYNLDVTVDNTLTLGKKRSWFGNLRDAVQNGALRAKAAVDSIRSDQHKSEQQKASDPDFDGEAEAESTRQSRQSTDSTGSTTQTKAFRERRHTLGSKNAVVSLRQHLPHHSAKHHHKRSSVYSVASRPSSEMANAAGADRFGSLQQLEDASTGHKRKTSIADSLVGSMRGLSRKTGIARPPSPEKQLAMERPAETVPLPSSPIDIPTMAPALELDLGPAGFMSTTFTGSPKQVKQEDLKLTDPLNVTTDKPKPCYIHIPDEIKTSSAIRDHVATPSSLLNLPFTPTIESDPTSLSAAATPMPGTNLTLEVDGTNSDKSDKSHVFERSVTPATGRERKELRTMRSLDAMAEACSVAHAYDEMLQDSDKAAAAHEDDECPPSDPGSPEVRFYTPRRHALSQSTVHSCYSDMDELTRQKAAQPLAAGAVQEEVKMQGWTIDDPFAPSSSDSVGPPSPERSVTLPFRPKVTVKAAQNETTATMPEHQIVDTFEEGDAMIVSSCATTERSLEAQLQLQRNHAVAQDLSNLERMPRPIASSEEVDSPEKLTSDDDMQARAEALLTSDIVLPSYEDAESILSGLSPHGGPLVPALYQGITTKDSPSPGTARSRTTYTAGLGDAEYKFTLDNWLKSSSSAAPPDEEPKTPHRRLMDSSIDSVSTTEERQTPEISPKSSNADQTPSMGNRLAFDLKRSQRNMRYNALHQESSDHDTSKHSLAQRQPLRFIVGASEETEASALQLADFASAYAGSRETSPQKPQKCLQARVGSEDSVADSLKAAASNYNKLEQCLEELQGGSGVLLSSVLDKENEAIEHYEDRDQRSASPSPEQQAKTTSMIGGALDPDNFSPIYPMTSKEKNSSPIRFTGLTVQQTQPSPDEVHPSSKNEFSESSAESPITHNDKYGKSRIVSSDTLDKTLHLYSSPDSGYQGDKSSASPGSGKAKGPPASRYRSLTKRSGAKKPLGERHSNLA